MASISRQKKSLLLAVTQGRLQAAARAVALGERDLAFLKARKQVLTEPEIAKVRKALHLQARLFPLLLIFAAAMARGYGSV